MTKQSIGLVVFSLLLSVGFYRHGIKEDAPAAMIPFWFCLVVCVIVIIFELNRRRKR